jgi:hypothetical protein
VAILCHSVLEHSQIFLVLGHSCRKKWHLRHPRHLLRPCPPLTLAGLLERSAMVAGPHNRVGVDSSSTVEPPYSGAEPGGGGEGGRGGTHSYTLVHVLREAEIKRTLV